VGRHADRLARDARLLGLAAPDGETVRRAMSELARDVFGDGDGIVRVKVCAGEAGGSHLLATTRPLGDEPSTWRAVVARFPHPGPGDHPGAKLSERLAWTRARALCEERGVDETLLFDDGGRLVEGARTNLVVVAADGRTIFPDPALGAVAGIGLAVIADAISATTPGELRAEDLSSAREVVAVNAVRGPRPIVRIDGAPVADGRPGPVARRLGAAFAAALQDDLRSAR